MTIENSYGLNDPALPFDEDQLLKAGEIVDEANRARAKEGEAPLRLEETEEERICRVLGK